MAAIHIRNVPESILAALRARAARRGHSLQRELLEILAAAAGRPSEPNRSSPLELITVKTQVRSSWRRAEMYGPEER
jgi:plasmid stability protein